MGKTKLDPSQWVDRYADYLYNYTISKVSDQTLAEDLVQETFLAGLKSASGFKGDASERTWLTAILKRKIIDHYRRANSGKGKAEVKINYTDEDQEGDWLEERAADKHRDNIEDQLQNEELGVAIERCISQLPEKQARIFRMKTIEGMETEDICKELQITPSNLWVIIHRARTTLMSCLEKNWF